MVLNKRQRQIVELVESRGEMAVNSLADLCQVSPMTIRRDLALLERENFLLRVHGGAIPAEKDSFTFSFKQQKVPYLREKQIIAQNAAKMVTPSMMVLLDTGNTLLEIAKALNPIQPITVVTCSLSVLSELYRHPNVNVSLVGGDVSKDTHEVYGPLTEQNFGAISADIAFVGADGISADGNFTASDLIGARIATLMIQAAKKVVVVADHSKLGSTARISYASADQIDCLITTAPESDPTVTALKSSGINVINT